MVAVTAEHLRAARLAGACETVERIEPGTPVAGLSSSDLRWFADNVPDLAEALAKQLTAEGGAKGAAPLDLLGSGSGDGYGYGSGS